jgi:hypothetical protein
MAIANPVSKTGIVNRFLDLVTSVVNTGIVWGTNNKPFTEMPDGNYAGTTAGDSINITGADITDTIITASTIRTVLETEAALYTNIRQQRAILFVTGGGGNTGSRPTPGTIFDQTQVAHLDTGNRAALGAISSGNVTTGNIINDTNLETYMGNIATAYNTIRTTTITDQVDVCHASCHSSCHGSRGRR